jgi:serine/threonine-protein kinase
MSLAIGTRIGPFEITGVLGAGGMGEVYRGRDARLGRDAALKILPDSLAADPDRVARFTREAQVLASLSHPNIGGIYGLEEAQSASGPTRALVLELVEGDTLADRISRGPMPVDEALAVARQIAEALQAAHDQNVIHRDLKPANIKITPDGVVKVLDFGLAKLIGPPDAGGRGAGEPAFAAIAAQPPTESPTITTPAMTNVGTILGTAAYMAPEQAKGRAADKRSDVWALGCVIYEMLAGVRPFAGEDVADTLAAVLRAEPEWTRLPSDVPPPVANVLRRCLDKDRRTRTGDVAAVLFAIDHARAATSPGAAPTPVGWPRRLGGIAGWSALGAAIAAAGVWALYRPTPGPVTRLSLAPPDANAFRVSPATRDIAISRDGRRVVYSGDEGKLIVRSLDSFDPTVIDGLGSAASPFFAPDGQSIGFFRRNVDLRVVPAAGGPSVQRVGLQAAFSGGATWNDEGRIVYATTDRVTGLLDLPAGATSATVLTRPDRTRGEADHLWPEFLPGGRGVLFTITQLNGQPGTGQVAVYDLATKTTTVIVSSGTHARYTPTGHLVYSAAGALRAIRFDLDALKTVGESKLVVPGVSTKAGGAANFDIADNGTLVYVPGAISGAAERELVWVARDGTTESVNAPRRPYLYPRISPDGTRAVLDIRDQDNDLWMLDLRTRILTRFTDSPALDRFPLWTPDGAYVIFVSARSDGSSAIYRQSADGGGAAEPITDPTPEQQTPNAVTSDGKQLLFDYRGDIMSMPLDGSRKASPIFKLPGMEMRSVVSRDRQWIAYHGDEAGSGQTQVYVRPFAAPASARWQVSPNGGVEPWWSPKGDELFYVSTATQQLMSVRVSPGPGWTPEPPKVVFEQPYYWGSGAAGTAAATFDVAKDGRLLMIRNVSDPETTTPPNIEVVQNWFQELERLVP